MKTPFHGLVSLVTLDLISLFGAFSVAHRIRLGEWIDPLSAALWMILLSAVLCMYVMDAYAIRETRRTWKFVQDSFAAIIGVGLTNIVLIYLVGVEHFAPIYGRGVLPVAVIIFCSLAIGYRWLISEKILTFIETKAWLVIADTKTFEAIGNMNLGLKLNLFHRSFDCSIDEVNNWFKEHPKFSKLVIQEVSEKKPQIAKIIERASDNSISWISVANFYEQYWQKIPAGSLDDDWIANSLSGRMLSNSVGFRLKRVTDFLIAVFGLLITFPILILVACMIFVTSPGSVIYQQKRVGLNGKTFTLFKFRSMVEDAEKVGPQWAIVKDPRVTKIGRFLRASRIDELPQLVNLILGNMSLIGPRPERPKFVTELKKEIPYFEMRERVVPSLTGWAQVKYPYGSSIQDSLHKLEYDLFYIKNQSIRMDISIVLRTILVVLKGGGR